MGRLRVASGSSYAKLTTFCKLSLHLLRVELHAESVRESKAFIEFSSPISIRKSRQRHTRLGVLPTIRSSRLSNLERDQWSDERPGLILYEFFFFMYTIVIIGVRLKIKNHIK